MKNPAKGLIVSPTKGLFFNPFKEQIAHEPIPEPKDSPPMFLDERGRWHLVKSDATDALTDEEEFWGKRDE